MTPHLNRFDHSRMSPAAVRRALGERPVTFVTATPEERAAPDPTQEAAPDPPPWSPPQGMAAILKAVAQASGIPANHLRNKRRGNPRVIPARQLVCFLIRHRTGASLEAIAAYTGRDHTTILYSIRKAPERMETDVALRAIYDRAVAILDGGGT